MLKKTSGSTDLFVSYATSNDENGEEQEQDAAQNALFEKYSQVFVKSVFGTSGDLFSVSEPIPLLK